MKKISEFKPALPYIVPIVFIPPIKKKIKGVLTTSYQNIEEVEEKNLVFCSFKTFGGTEQIINDIYTIIDTANIETFYKPEITKGSKIVLMESKEEYEIIGSPENINQRNQFMKFKVKKIEGCV